MPIPSPKGEPKKNFLSKCMGDSVMVKEFPDEKQRYAVCQSKWKKSVYETYNNASLDQDWTEEKGWGTPYWTSKSTFPDGDFFAIS